MNQNLKKWFSVVPALKDAAVFGHTNGLRQEKVVYPSQDRVFRALEMVSPEDVRVVILGQDPYHGEGQADGLAFSVPNGIKIPPSLRNIFKEIDADINGGVATAHSTDLTRWADQGVLLLNAILTVEAGKAKSHHSMGWEQLTDSIIQYLGRASTDVVFLLWGDSARSKASFVDREANLVLESVHPSPLSAYRGFLGCGHFSSANDFLKSRGRPEIDWN